MAALPPYIWYYTHYYKQCRCFSNFFFFFSIIFAFTLLLTTKQENFILNFIPLTPLDRIYSDIFTMFV